MFRFFKIIIQWLHSQNIPYMLSGSIAMSLYVLPRSTRDIDFVISLKPADAEAMANYFNEGYYCHKGSITDAIAHAGIFNIIDHESGFKADFVVLKNQPFRQAEFARRQLMSFENIPLYVVTPEDLLISKIIWIQDFQSPQQMDDIAQLAALANIDKAYIKNWIETLKLNTFGLI